MGFILDHMIKKMKHKQRIFVDWYTAQLNFLALYIQEIKMLDSSRTEQTTVQKKL